MKTSAKVEMKSRGGYEGWRSARRWLLHRRARLNWQVYHKKILPKAQNEANHILPFRCAHSGRPEPDSKPACNGC